MFYNVAKKLVDIFGSLLGIIILSPLLILVSVAIKIDSRGPVFANTPMRVGQNGKLFRIYKFRSLQNI